MSGAGRIAYLTDVEGRWDKLATFADGSAGVRLEGERLRLADGVTFVFGGDASDRGPHARRLLATLLEAHARYGERVVLLAGNRDLNKLRLRRELDGAPPARTPEALRRGPRGPLLSWILAHTMGAKEAFEHRRAELGAPDDDTVVESFLEDVRPGGLVLAYLAVARLGFRAGRTLFVHGGVTRESLGTVPGRAERIAGIDAWLEQLAAFYEEQLGRYHDGESPDALLAYQAPQPGTAWNQASVVYGRLADEHANPTLPASDVVRALRDDGISRLVVGHTPSGDCPAILRDGGFELVLADNAYGRLELGSRVSLTDDAISVAAETVLDDGTRAAVRFESTLEEPGPLGRRDEPSGRLVKARLADGDYLLFRGLPARRVEQVRASEAQLAARALVAPRP